MEECIFKTHYRNIVWVMPNWKINLEKNRTELNQSLLLAKIGETRCTKHYSQFNNDPNLKIKCHSNCANKYCFMK